MLGAGHGRLHEQVARLLQRQPGWITSPEVSFSVFGERGVIDVPAFHPARRMLLVIELKTELVDVQALLTAVDRYRRLAPRRASEKGWQARDVATWVILRDTSTSRRRVAAHATVLRSALPSDGRTMRSWLRDPHRPLAALSFLSDVHGGTAKPRSGGPRRVRLGVARSPHAGDSVGDVGPAASGPGVAI